MNIPIIILIFIYQLLKWRCLFRCGIKKVQSFLGKEVNICQDVAFQFHLSIQQKQKDEENMAIQECSSKFEDITSDMFLQAKYFCNFTKCNPPIAKEILPPLYYRHFNNNSQNDTESFYGQKNREALLRLDPILVNKLGMLDKERLEKLWNRSQIKLTEDNLLNELDKQIIQLKVDVCSQSNKIRNKADLQLEKLSFFVEQVQNQDDMKKSMLLGLVAFTNFNQQLLQPFVFSIQDEQLILLNEQLKNIVIYLREIKNQCYKQKKFIHNFQQRNITIQNPNDYQWIHNFIKNNQHDKKFL